MGKTFDPLKILTLIETELKMLSKKQLKLLFLLLSSAAKNNGKGKLGRKTVDNFANVYFNGEDLFVICRVIKKLGCGSLTCCGGNDKKFPPCLEENWQELPIGIRFSDFRRKPENDKTRRTNRKNNERHEV